MIVAYIVVVVWFVLEILFNFIDKGGKGGKQYVVLYYCFRHGCLRNYYLLR